MKYQELQFPLVIGFVDGMLTSLTFAAGSLTIADAHPTLSLALRMGAASLVSSGFVFFVGKYAELRGQLIHAGKELNIIKKGQLASTKLGKIALNRSIYDSIVSGISGFVGGFLPIIFATLDPLLPWITLLSSVIILGIFGFILGHIVGKNPYIWTGALFLGGILVSLIGIQLHII